MLLFKKKYYLFVENTRDFNLNLIKIRGKFHIIYRNIKSKEKIDTLRIYRNNCKKNGINFYIANDTNLLSKVNADGLTISASYYDFDELGTKNSKQTSEGGSVALNYAYGNLSIGYGETRHVPNLRTGQSNTAAHTKGYENEAYSIGWAVNDALSVSYTNEESTKVAAYDNVAGVRQDSNVTMEIDTIDLSYTVGGMTIGLSQSETSADSYTTGDEVTETILAVSMAF